MNFWYVLLLKNVTSEGTALAEGFCGEAAGPATDQYIPFRSRIEFWYASCLRSCVLCGLSAA
jgi:hypothetical protein